MALRARVLRIAVLVAAIVIASYIYWRMPIDVNRDVRPASSTEDAVAFRRGFGPNEQIDSTSRDPYYEEDSSEENLQPSNSRNGPLTAERLLYVLTNNPPAKFSEIAEAPQEVFIDAVSDILNDPADSEYWNLVLVFLYEMEDAEQLSDVLIDFIVKDERSLLESGGFVSDLTLRQKTSALRMLGRTGGERASHLLQEAISEDGAKKIASNWLDEVADGAFDDNESRYLHYIRAEAARGLAFTGDPEDFRILKNEYERFHAMIQARYKRKLKPGERQRIKTSSERDFEILYNDLVEGMATASLIADIGKENYSEQIVPGDAVGRQKRLGPYLRKFQFRYDLYQLSDGESP